MEPPLIKGVGVEKRGFQFLIQHKIIGNGCKCKPLKNENKWGIKHINWLLLKLHPPIIVRKKSSALG